MQVDQLVHEGRLARLWGRRACAEVTAPLPGVFRIRLAPASLESNFAHPTLAPKRSWAVVGGAPLPLECQRQGDEVTVSTPEGALRLSMGTFQWELLTPDGVRLSRGGRVEGEAAPGYPVYRHRSSFELDAPSDEAYLGLGEKVGPLDKRGMRLRFWNTDVMPHHPDTDPLYVSIPFFVAMGGPGAWGLFLDEPWRSDLDLAATDPSALRWVSTGPELDLYLLCGPDPASVLRRYVQLTGRPFFPPLWSLGVQQSRWGYENAEQVRGVVQGYRAHRLPLDCVYLDIDHQDAYQSLSWDRTRFPAPEALAREVGDAGVKLVCIVDPGLSARPGDRLFEEAKASDFLVRTDRGDVLYGEVWPAPAAFPDFSRDEVVNWWAAQHRPFIEAGIAGFWNDMNEPSCFRLHSGRALSPHDMPVLDVERPEGKTLPDLARHGARRHLEVHNIYGLEMSRGTHAGLRQHAPHRRPFVLTRAGYAGVQRYAAVWTGDNSSHWEHLELSIPMLVGLGLSGVPFCGADVPGFLGSPGPELYARWMQLATFYPLLRIHSAKGSPWQEPWRGGETQLRRVRAALERRYRLLPTLYTLMHEAAQSGLPPLRPLVLDSTASLRERLGAFDQFLFGAGVLVAPVVRPGQSKRLAFIPEGRWLEWPNAERRGAVVEGPRHVIADAPSDVVPMWLREGHAVALTEPALHTTDANWKQLTWQLHPGPQIEGTLYEDAGDGEGPFRLTRLTGEWRPEGLRLRCAREGALAMARETEKLRLYVDQPPTGVRGARSHRFADGVLELELPADWFELELDGLPPP